MKQEAGALARCPSKPCISRYPALHTSLGYCQEALGQNSTTIFRRLRTGAKACKISLFC